ncbi:MAG: hypothetical protein J6X08_04735 [Lachnospiraceae bacterium]|nr:hypothetical protein [Lachnospiraceae bacterium]
MKKTGKRLTAVMISLAVILGSTIGCFAAQKTGGAETIEAEESVDILKDTETAVTAAVQEVEKEEAAEEETSDIKLFL